MPQAEPAPRQPALVARIMGILINPDMEWQKIDREPDKKETPAQFQEACAQLALAMLWGERKEQPPWADAPEGRPGGQLVNGHR